MEVLALVLAGVAIVIVFAIELIKRPRIEIDARPWAPKQPVPWTFAVVHVRNKPLPHVLRSLFVRQMAAGATVTLDFKKDGARVMPQIPGRWSSRPEPLRLETGGPGSLAAALSAQSASAAHSSTAVSPMSAPTTVKWTFEPSLVPQTLAQDLAPGHWEEVAVAILLQTGPAFGWGAESYAHGGQNPAWKLDRGEYEVTVRVDSSGISKERTFRLDNLAVDFGRFRLTPLD